MLEQNSKAGQRIGRVPGIGIPSPPLERGGAQVSTRPEEIQSTETMQAHKESVPAAAAQSVHLRPDTAATLKQAGHESSSPLPPASDTGRSFFVHGGSNSGRAANRCWIQPTILLDPASCQPDASGKPASRKTIATHPGLSLSGSFMRRRSLIAFRFGV